MPGRVLDCPQCGAPVQFQSSVSVFAVCEHCRSMVVLRDAKVDTMGVMAELPPDLSPFQVGTTGQWEGKGFQIVGRLRVEWDEGSWNEWCFLYDGTTTGWLAEAQGLLMVSFETAPDTALPAGESQYEAGSTLTLLGRHWTVSDAKQTRTRAGEGELPFIAPPNAMRVSVDLINPHGGFANIDFEEQGPVLYVGKYGRFEDFHFQNLRPVPGWSADIAEERNLTNALSCPSCGAPVNLRALGQTMAAVCGSCGAVIDTATPELTLIEKAEHAKHEVPTLIPVGQRGKLFDLELEMIGLMMRRDDDSTWTEYLLFNPWYGFRWLVFYEGHWSYVTQMPAMPDAKDRSVAVEGSEYRLYAKGTATVTAVLGEFYWKVRRGEKTDYLDYISPPRILSKESYPGLNEFTWSQGEYVEHGVIAEAFALKDLPAPRGLYLNEPNRYAARWVGVRKICAVALGILLLLEFGFTASNKSWPVYASGYSFDRRAPATVPKVAVTPPFEVAQTQRITVQATANVNNNWLDLDLELVNAKTNRTVPQTLEISYYSGYDGGQWSEGGNTTTVDFPEVEPGQYFLTIEPSADPSIIQMPFTLRISRGGVYQSNFLLSLLAILLYPLFLWWRGAAFEKERWSDSSL